MKKKAKLKGSGSKRRCEPKPEQDNKKDNDMSTLTATKRRLISYFFESSSSSALYETVVWNDGTTTCDCPGWTRRSIRQCKHTALVLGGLAEARALRTVKHVGASVSVSQARPPKTDSDERDFDFSVG